MQAVCMQFAGGVRVVCRQAVCRWCAGGLLALSSFFLFLPRSLHALLALQLLCSCSACLCALCACMYVATPLVCAPVCAFLRSCACELPALVCLCVPMCACMLVCLCACLLVCMRVLLHACACEPVLCLFACSRCSGCGVLAVCGWGLRGVWAPCGRSVGGVRAVLALCLLCDLMQGACKAHDSRR